jgi:AraC-like DNA-binding protein
MKIEWIAVPEDLRKVAHAFYVSRLAQGSVTDTVPAYSAQLLVHVEGASALRFSDASRGIARDIAFNAPMLECAELTTEGPALILGVSLTALGWAGLSGLPVDGFSDRTVAGAAIFVPEAMARLEAALAAVRAAHPRDDRSLSALTDAVAAELRHLPHGPCAEHREVIAALEHWLGASPDPFVAELFDKAPWSQRHIQRLCRRYYGVPPSQLLKRQRAIRAALVLANADISEEMRSEVLLSYFDQPHLIRDMRRFTGKTPAALVKNGRVVNTLEPRAHGPVGKAIGKGRRPQEER